MCEYTSSLETARYRQAYYILSLYQNILPSVEITHLLY